MTPARARRAPAYVAVLAVLGVGAGRASADAVPGPPDDCPAGARGETSHTDTYCAATICASDADCSPSYGYGSGSDPSVCTAAVGLCLEPRTRVPGGRWPSDSPPAPVTYDVATGSCASDSDCAAPSRCVVTSRCTPRTAAQFVARALGCSVAPAPRRPAAPALVVALSVLAALAARRRRALPMRRTRA